MAEQDLESTLYQALTAYARDRGFRLGEEAARHAVDNAVANIQRRAFDDDQRQAALQQAIGALPQLERAITAMTASRAFPDRNSVQALRESCKDVPYPWNCR